MESWNPLKLPNLKESYDIEEVAVFYILTFGLFYVLLFLSDWLIFQVDARLENMLFAAFFFGYPAVLLSVVIYAKQMPLRYHGLSLRVAGALFILLILWMTITPQEYYSLVGYLLMFAMHLPAAIMTTVSYAPEAAKQCQLNCAGTD
jgi:hypothetical protein